MTWSPGGWCEACNRYHANVSLYVSPSGDGRTWRCDAHVPQGFVLAPGEAS